MGYERANWRSGLTYMQACDQCQTQVTYMDNILDFRPWFPDGFVYCPTCKKPLRHNEGYAINRPVAPVAVDMTQGMPVTAPITARRPAFCTDCGRAYGQDDNFCRGCGKKR